MPAPKGNKYGKGKKGRSGRKSAYKEEARARMLADAWFGKGVEPDKLKEEIQNALSKNKKKLQLFKYYLFRAIKSDKVLLDMAKKLFPDKKELSGDLDINMTFADWVEQIDKD